MPTVSEKPHFTILPSPSKSHRTRRMRIHLFCFLVFCALPFFNVIRFDIPRQRFYFAGFELWISEFNIVFFTLMFLMFVIAAVSMIYGRMYCAYLCPQMIFSETANRVEDWIARYVRKRFIHWTPTRRRLAERAALYGLIAVASVFLSFVFISYFVEPRDLLRRLVSLDIVTAGGIAGAATTLFTFADFAFLRQRFCTSVCPYGYLQGMLADKHTLLVSFDSSIGRCIECKKCLRVCHMGIDIRNSPFQIECIHCGECIDACDEVLGRMKRPGMIRYTWGEGGEAVGNEQRPWWYRIGLRDAKRGIVLAVLTFYASGLFIALSMRHTVLVKISPDRATMYSRSASGEIINKFRMTVANRGSQPASVQLALDGLPGAHLVFDPNPVAIAAGETRTLNLHVASDPQGPPPGVSHFQFVTRSSGENAPAYVPMTFIMPESKTRDIP